MFKGGIKPIFNVVGLKRHVKNYVEEQTDKMLRVMQYVGEEAINKARINGEYRDRTGNLRASVGYIVLIDGQLKAKALAGNNAGSKADVNRLITEQSAIHSKGWVLVFFAGMEYAAAVEARGYDVISSSRPTRDILIRAMKDFDLAA